MLCLFVQQRVGSSFNVELQNRIKEECDEMKQNSGGMIRFDGRYAVLVDGIVVAVGSHPAMKAAAVLFCVDNMVGCMTPNGRTDSHGAYVEWDDDKVRKCMLCGEPT